VGEYETLIQSSGIWKELVDDARIRGLIKPIKANKLIQLMKDLEVNTANHSSDSNCGLSSEPCVVSLNINTRYILS
jgi:hypothetical protein